MYELLADAGAELFALVMYGLGTVVLSLVGLVAEYNSVQQYLGGHQWPAVWLGVFGLVALGLALDLAREEVLPALAAWRTS
ncbi:hypothetical protein [Salinirussus salinus]|uniref:hypothetical protein n=1 Tax=Salinirussus salinus TaxID=1198300 RepID=UPI00135BCCBC|nr:hypothetical protein [Salinirussus salinus]